MQKDTAIDCCSADYAERVYAGVLGKVIGVTTGKPIEGWSYERIVQELGEVNGYIHDRLGYPLICTDDDISGTFTFLRAIEDNGYRLDLSAKEISKTWLNYLIEGKSVLWWGGNGNSTEHTAYLRLRNGIEPPLSGSCLLNGKRISEQIGSQIFIDGWAMVYPGEPAKAAELAHRAATVSHDGEAIYGAVALAAMVSLAFAESDLDRLIECSLSLIPADSTIAEIIRDVRQWAKANGADWRATRLQVADKYGADKYGVGHMIPNHALIHLALWHGEGDLARSLDIINTCGWDTDCNAGNLGCLLGVRNGLAGIPASLRDPIADRVYTPTADAGRGISDCLREAAAIINMARLPRGLPEYAPKNGAAFSFALPGSVQGFISPSCGVSNDLGDALHLKYQGKPTILTTPTFIPPNLEDMHGYELLASPRVYSGQRLRASIAGPAGVEAAFVVRYFGTGDVLSEWTFAWRSLSPSSSVIEETVPDLGGMPIYEVGIALKGSSSGTVSVDWLDIDGIPCVDLLKGELAEMSKAMWVSSSDQLDFWPGPSAATLAITQNHGRGMAIVGCRKWKDYSLDLEMRPRLGGRFGAAVSCQGLRRFVGVLIDSSGRIELGYQLEEWVPLASAQACLELDSLMSIRLSVSGSTVEACVNGVALAGEIPDGLRSGAAALVADEARLDVRSFKISPVA